MIKLNKVIEQIRLPVVLVVMSLASLKQFGLI